MELILFYLFAGVVVSSALLVVFFRNPLSSALALVAALFGVAALFVLLHAYFLAAIQVLVYAGAVMVLFIFIIMMMNLDLTTLRKIHYSFTGIVGALFGSYLAAILILRLGYFSEAARATPEDYGSIASIGKLLFTDYQVPFEMTSLLLLVAIIGAVMLAKKEAKHAARQAP